MTFCQILDVLIYYQQNFPLLSKKSARDFFNWITDKNVCVCVCVCEQEGECALHTVQETEK